MASNTTFGEETSGYDVATTYGAQARGKTILITGVTVGSIGDAIAKSFAKGGASKIIITGRDEGRLSTAAKALSDEYPSTTFRPLKLQLDSLKLVRAAAQEILNDDSIPTIDITVACAGVHDFADNRILTTDGLEWHLGVNHLSHFVFVNDLLPKIRAAAKSNAPNSTRIISVSSEMAFASPFRFSDYQFDEKPIPKEEEANWEFLSILKIAPHTKYDHWIAYGQSKTANVLFALHLNKLLAEDNITAFSLHPGLVASQYALHFFDVGLTAEQKEIFSNIAGKMKTVEQGAATAVVAALDPELSPKAGIYLSDCQIKSPIPEYLTSEEGAEKLWKLSEEIVKEKLG